jgi:hypothetical protein
MFQCLLSCVVRQAHSHHSMRVRLRGCVIVLEQSRVYLSFYPAQTKEYTRDMAEVCRICVHLSIFIYTCMYICMHVADGVVDLGDVRAAGLSKQCC